MNIRTSVFALALFGCIACGAPTTGTPPTAEPVIDSTATLAITAEPAATPTADPTGEGTPDGGFETSAPNGDEFLFLRDDTLIAYSVTAQITRTIATDVSTFVVAPDMRSIALVRGSGAAGQLWIASVDGDKQLQLTDNQQSFADIHWLPDSSGIVYAASNHDSTTISTWLEWSAFCRESSVYLLSLSTRKPQELGAGCDPAVSPDGLRIAYATPPTRSDAQSADPDNTADNSIRLINIKGENGCNPGSAKGGEVGSPDAGLVVYHPVWTPDSKAVVYQAFIGMRIEVDINAVAKFDARDGTQTLLGSFAGWGRQLTFSPDTTAYALTSQNVGDARGWGGWDVWRTDLFDMTGEREIFLPEGAFMVQGQALGEPIWYGQHFVWMNENTLLAIVLPPNWQPGLSPSDELAQADVAGELWVIDMQGEAQQIATDVDYASPVAYIP